MELTDNELGLIEQLTYIHGDVAKEAGVNNFTAINGGKKGLTIDQILAGFDEEALNTLEAKGDQDIGFVSAKEWAGIIRSLKTGKMKDLVLVDTMENVDGRTLGLCFSEKDSEHAVVAFRGTANGTEWVDNVEGLNETDTACQKEALDFIESLPYDQISVTGHSKGGNKAMYVAITSDKVDRCVSYDGQGFSPEFMEKYWAEIQNNSGKIKAYSLSTDYVHALLFPVPGATQIYCEGFGVANIGEHHSPNSFFQTDKFGHLVLDENGSPIIVTVSESESITMLHEFTAFVVNNADEQDKTRIINYVSKLLELVFGGDNVSQQDIIDYCLSDPDTLAIIVAYLVRYMDVQDLDSQDINKLLEVLGLDSLDEMFNVEVGGLKIVGLAGIIDYAKKQLTDGNDDAFLKNVVLPILKKWKFDGLDLDISAFWERINSKVREIDTDGGCDDATSRSGTVRDFSQNIYQALTDCINHIEGTGGISVSGWNNYSAEEWYGPLLVNIAVKCINTYFAKITDANQACKVQIDQIFGDVNDADTSRAARLSQSSESLMQAASRVNAVAQSIG